MQARSHEGKYQIAEISEPVVLVPLTIDNLALTWSIGIGIGYAFLISFICWIIYRCLLIWNAYTCGDIPFVLSELKTDLLISAGYFGIAAVLRKKGIL